MKNPSRPNNQPVNVGVVGATGVVGETFLQILEQRGFPVGNLRLYASKNSEGQTRKLNGRSFQVETLKPGCFEGLDLVFFSSGDDISKEWAPEAVKAGAYAVDNSAAFRMDDKVHLVVPEVNGDLLATLKSPAIIANPNCSTIQLVVALAPLQKKYGLKSVRVSSYQSVSGAGREGLEELIDHTKIALEAEEPPASKTFSKSVAFDSIPQIGSINEDGYSSEEMKIIKETSKIMREPNLPVSAFAVRVPTMNSHAEAVWVTLERTPRDKSEVEATLASGDGIQLVNNEQKLRAGPSSVPYPTQVIASGTDPVYVGRVHRDLHDSNTWLMWVVADNLRKGAALNGCQIAERIFDITPRA